MSIKIADLIEDYTMPKWEDYPDVPGFRVLVRLPDVPKGVALAMRAYRESEGQDGDQALPETARYLASYAAADWQGLTVAGLKLLTGLKVAGEDTQIIPYNPDNLESLLRLSAPFFLWLLGKAQERINAARQEAAETENLSATPNTTPIPSP